MGREPSCTNNHEVQRRDIRDAGLSERICVSCGWKLYAAREEEIEEVLDESRIREIIRQELVSYGLIPGSAEDE